VWPSHGGRDLGGWWEVGRAVRRRTL